MERLFVGADIGGSWQALRPPYPYGLTALPAR